MEIKNLPLDQLKPFAKNPKRHPEKQISMLIKSMGTFGFTSPILIDSNKMIIAGHARYQAAKELGLTEVPTILIDLPYEKAVAYVIADNRLAEIAEEDGDLMRELLAEISNIPDFDIEAVGFSVEEIDNLLNNEPVEVVEDEFNPDEEVETRCKEGDLWVLGSHRLLCGDSTIKENIDRLMGGVKADITFTSPPYNVGGNNICSNKSMKNLKYGTSNDDTDQNTWFEMVQKTIDNTRKHSIYQIYNIQQLSGNKFAFIDLLFHNKSHFVDTMIWFKGQGCPAIEKNVMNSRFEYIIILSEEENPNRKIKTGDFQGTVSNVFEKSGNGSNEYSKIHAATFPIELPAHIIENFTVRGSAVIDCFGGTGTTLIACEQTGRISYNCELDPRYCDVIISRWEQFSGQTAQRIN